MPNRKGIFQLNVSGKMIDFQWYDYNKVAMPSFDTCDKESVIESVHNYFLDFFGPSMKYHWRVDDVEEDFNLFLPKLQNTSLCTDIRLNEDFKDMENLEALFSSSPVFKAIRLEAALTTELFNSESKFYQAESICVNQSHHTFPDILRHFKGRQAMIYCGQWETSQDLIELVNKWKSGEAFQNLEYLDFELGDGEILENQILNGIGAKYIDESKKPPAHTLPKVYDFVISSDEPNTKPINSYTYVVRATDNRVASIMIQEKTISFGVWNMTEEGFLKLMD
ncbi:hypothetical protein B9Z55_000820 [Caenorhabditis nigoni]|uniref:F-box associated domain-containing protein n=1 Tax=Caenorhabditis nigoni TaxID=1611254 RepID=A0A2G5VV06_9PELO|nr:hypothetical protein B9Z55_000820 [Caenorhabditis nigoni]